MRFNTITEWLSWLEQLHPTEIELGLERIARVWNRLHPDPVPFRVITVGGTNGKGSSVAMLQEIYRAAGYRVGAYTSPHIELFNERIRIDGRMVDDDELCRAFDAVENTRAEVSLTYFEFGTLAALHIFCRHGLDLAVLEVGLGGRLDAVNIIDPDVSLISSIALDHQAWLGDDVDQIAREKAGIMRTGRPVIFNGETPPNGLVAVADELGAELKLRGRDYFRESSGEQWWWRMGTTLRNALPLPSLRGRHQIDNASAVLAVVECLNERLPINQEAVRSGLLEASVAGRFQVIGGDVPVVLDVAHNPEAAAAFAETLGDMYCAGATHAVFGILDDKDIAGVLQPLLKRVDVWHVSAPDSARALDAETAASRLRQQDVEKLTVHDSLEAAYRKAVSDSIGGDRIVVVGSFFTVSEVSRLL